MEKTSTENLNNMIKSIFKNDSIPDIDIGLGTSLRAG